MAKIGIHLRTLSQNLNRGIIFLDHTVFAPPGMQKKMDKYYIYRTLSFVRVKRHKVRTYKHNTYCTWLPLPDGSHANIRIYLIFLENRMIGLHFTADSMGLSSFIFFLLGSVKRFYFRKSDVSAVQDVPRSLSLVPIESAYATSY